MWTWLFGIVAVLSIGFALGAIVLEGAEEQAHS